LEGEAAVMLIRHDLALEDEIDTLAPSRKKRGRPEMGIQRAILGFIARCCPGADARAIPNDSMTRSAQLARRSQGVIAGTPDLVVIAPGGVTVWLEVKAPRGTLSEAQKATHARWRGLGHHVAVVRSIEDAEDALRAAGVPVSGTADPVRSLKRRGWEAAYVMLQDFSPAIPEDDRERVIKADKVGPVSIRVEQAEAMLRLADRVMGRRA
jgi:hypothetical protein